MPAIQALLDVAELAKFDDKKLKKLFVDTLKALDEDLVEGEYVSSDEMDTSILALQERYDDYLAEQEQEEESKGDVTLETAEEASEEEVQETLDEVEEENEDEPEDEVTR